MYTGAVSLTFTLTIYISSCVCIFMEEDLSSVLV